MPVPETQHFEEYQARFHEESWRALAARPFIWGKFVWSMFDFASDRRAEGDLPGRNGICCKAHGDAILTREKSKRDERAAKYAKRF